MKLGGVYIPPVMGVLILINFVLVAYFGLLDTKYDLRTIVRKQKPVGVK
jgi:hypothetical protein